MFADTSGVFISYNSSLLTRKPEKNDTGPSNTFDLLYQAEYLLYMRALTLSPFLNDTTALIVTDRFSYLPILHSDMVMSFFTIRKLTDEALLVMVVVKKYIPPNGAVKEPVDDL